MLDNFTTIKTIREFIQSPPNAAAAEQFVKSSKLQKTDLTETIDREIFSPLSAEKRIFYDFFKRAVDINLSLAMLLISTPLLILIVAAIKFSGRGGVIFKHRRIGRNGKEFDCWKFRTMVSDAEEILRRNSNLQKQFADKFKIEDDPRITPLGKLLRRTSLDELPQLVQVLQGQMSLIGPRPIVARELDKYSIYREKLLSVKPGLSGLWQTSGRSETTYAERVLLDMEYIDNRSVLLDTKILFKTVSTVLKKSGAC